MNNSILKIRFTKEEMIGRIYMAVESEKKIMRSESVKNYKDIVGESISNMAIDMSCKELDMAGSALVEHVNLIANSNESEFAIKGQIGMFAFVAAESRYCNGLVNEFIDNEDISVDEVSKVLMSTSVIYKILQRLVETVLDNEEFVEDEMVDLLKETLEGNSVYLIQKAIKIKKKQFLNDVVGSLL